MGNVTAIRRLDYTILLIILVWLLVLSWQVWQVKTFEDSHNLMIQNKLGLPDILQGRTLEELNAVSYMNAYELSSGLIVPVFLFSTIVMGVCFMLSEFKCRMLERKNE